MIDEMKTLFKFRYGGEVWDMPPIYFRVWFYLNCIADGKEESILTEDGTTITLKPYELITTIRVLALNVAWFERGILKVPNPKIIEDVLLWLESNKIISREPKKKYTKITMLQRDNIDYSGERR
jgi:hypothetical protein